MESKMTLYQEDYLPHQWEFLTKGRANLKKRLRKAQLDAALSGNSTMLIWLGKQMLGQVDKQEIEHIRPIDEIEFDGI